MVRVVHAEKAFELQTERPNIGQIKVRDKPKGGDERVLQPESLCQPFQRRWTLPAQRHLLGHTCFQSGLKMDLALSEEFAERLPDQEYRLISR